MGRLEKRGRGSLAGGGAPRQSPKEGKGCKGSQPHQSPTPKGDTELAEKLKLRGQGSQGIQRSQNSSMSENGEDPLMSCSLSGPWDQAVGPLGKEASPILAAQGKDKLPAEQWCPPPTPLSGVLESGPRGGTPVLTVAVADSRASKASSRLHCSSRHSRSRLPSRNSSTKPRLARRTRWSSDSAC